MFESSIITLDLGIKKTKRYPCVVIKGMEHEFELEYFANRSFLKEASLPLYVEYEDEFINISNIDLTHKTLIELLSISKDYQVSIHKSESVIVDLDISNPTVLEKFIKL